MKAGIGSSISFGSRRLLAFGLILGVGLSVAGCERDTSMIGYWEGDRDWKKIEAASEAGARAIAAINLDLKADGTFVLLNGGIDFSGEWVASGTSIDLQVMTILNRPLEQQSEDTKKAAVFTVRYENKAMFIKTIADTTEIELKKKTKPN